jgi:hypothetical protein
MGVSVEQTIAPFVRSHVLMAGLYFCLIAIGLIEGAVGQQADLTGVWRCDDGGLYYIRQRGAEIFWFGEQSPTDPHWSNVAHGEIDSSGGIRLSWADVPKGRISSTGLLILRIESDDSFVAVNKTGGFGGSTWRRVH